MSILAVDRRAWRALFAAQLGWMFDEMDFALENVENPMLFGSLKPHELRESASELLDRVACAIALITNRPSSPAARCSASPSSAPWP